MYKRQAFALFSPTYTLGDSVESIFVEVEMSLDATTRVGFDLLTVGNTADTVRFGGYVSGGAVQGAAVASSTGGGLQIGTFTGGQVAIRNTSRRQVALFSVYVARNSMNQLGYYFQYDTTVSLGSTILGWTTSMDSFLIDEGSFGGGSPSGGATTFLGLTGTPGSWGTAGQYLRINSARNALEWVNAPTGGSGDDAFDWATVGNTDRIPLSKVIAGSSTAGQFLRVNSSNDGLEYTAAPSGGPSTSTDVSVLDALSADPTIADHSLGDIANVNGVLRELVAGTVDPHVYRGTIAKRTGNFYGDDVVEWESVNPDNIRINLLKSVLGASPPASLFIEFNSQNRYFETKVDRASGSDATLTFAYHKASGSPGIEETTAGVPFSVAFYRDENKTMAFTIQGSTNRWEDENREGFLSQDGVDDRINTLIPVIRRVPTFTAGDANQVLTVNPDGMGLGFKNLVSTISDPINTRIDQVNTRLTQVEVFERASRTTTQVAKDVSVVISTLNSSVAITGAMIPADSSDAELEITIAAVGETTGTGSFKLSDLYGKTAIAGAGVTLNNTNALGIVNTPDNNQYWIARDADGNLFMSSDTGDTYTVNIDVYALRTGGSGASTYQGLSNTPSTIGDPGQLVVVDSGGTGLTFKDEQHPIGIRVFDASLSRLSLASTSTTNRPAAATFFTPAFDLDDNTRGEFHASLELTIVPTSDVNMGFTRGQANQTADDRRRALTSIVFASDVAEEGNFVRSATAALEGVVLFNQPVYSLNTVVGNYFVLLVHNLPDSM